MTPDVLLCRSFLDDDLTPDQLTAFEQRVIREPALAQLLHEVAQDEVGLRDWAAGRSTSRLAVRRRRTLVAVCAIAAVLLIAVGAFLYRPIAGDLRVRLADARDAVFAEGTAHRIGDTLRAGDRIALDSGTVELVYANWAAVTLEGPGTYVVGPPSSQPAGANEEGSATPATHGYLERGTISVHCPPGAAGFTVEGPGIRVVDLGTRFVLAVDEKGETRADVTEGRIRFSSLDGGGRVVGNRTLFANEIAVVTGERFAVSAAPRIGDPETHHTRGGLLEVTLGETIVRSREDARVDGYAYGPHQVFDAETNETRIRLPYGQRSALFGEVRGVLTSPEIASGKFRSADPNSDAILEYRLRFDAPITAFRFTDGCSAWTLGPNTEGGVEYSTDGTTWLPIRTIPGPHEGSFTPLAENFSAKGFETNELRVRYFARGVPNPAGPVGERNVTVHLTGGSDWCGTAGPFFDHHLELTVTGAPD